MKKTGLFLVSILAGGLLFLAMTFFLFAPKGDPAAPLANTPADLTPSPDARQNDILLHGYDLPSAFQLVVEGYAFDRTSFPRSGLSLSRLLGRSDGLPPTFQLVSPFHQQGTYTVSDFSAVNLTALAEQLPVREIGFTYTSGLGLSFGPFPLYWAPASSPWAWLPGSMISIVTSSSAQGLLAVDAPWTHPKVYDLTTPDNLAVHVPDTSSSIQLAYVVQGFLFQEDFATGNTQRWDLTSAPTTTSLTMDLLAWSPNGAYLLGSPAGNADGAKAQNKLWALNQASGKMTGFSVNRTHTFTDPLWSPDNTHVVLIERFPPAANAPARTLAGQYLWVNLTDGKMRVLGRFTTTDDLTERTITWDTRGNAHLSVTSSYKVTIAGPEADAGATGKLSLAKGSQSVLQLDLISSLREAGLTDAFLPRLTVQTAWFSDGRTLFLVVQADEPPADSSGKRPTFFGHYNLAASQLFFTSPLPGDLRSDNPAPGSSSFGQVGLRPHPQRPWAFALLDDCRLAIYSPLDRSSQVTGLLALDSPYLYADWHGDKVLAVSAHGLFLFSDWAVPRNIGTASAPPKASRTLLFEPNPGQTINKAIALSPDGRYLLLPLVTPQADNIFTTTLQIVDLALID